MHLRRTIQLICAVVVSFAYCCGCAPSIYRCAEADRVDRVDDSWLVMSSPSGETEMMHRSSHRRSWREGDVVIDGRVVSGCAEPLRRKTRALRELLLD